MTENNEKIVVGVSAPDFTLPDQNGNMHTLSEYIGRWVLVYFYPKDNTPGCTKEACSIRDSWSKFKEFGAEVLGVSTDSVQSHKNFEEKHSLPFTLLSDSNKEVVEKYGVWGMKSFMGRSFLGTKRMSFLVNPEGKIAKIYENVKPELHAEEVLQDIKSQI